MGNVSVKPQNIGSSACPIWIGVSGIVSENLPIGIRTTARSILGQVHRTGVVIVVKAIAGAAIRSRLGVVETIDEFRRAVYSFCIAAPAITRASRS